MVSGTIDKGDLDSFTFAATAGSTVQLQMVDVAGTSFVPAMAVYNPTGGAVTSTYSATTATISFVATVTGTYTLVAYDWSTGAASSGDYTLSFTSTP